MESVFSPRSVAIIGASNNPKKIGWCYANSLISLGFPRVYLVNRHEREVQGLPAYASILDIPDEVEQVVLITPAHDVLQTVEECGRKGIRVGIVHTSGFSELGAEGVALQEDLVRTARAAGMRLIGPNCLGVHCPSSRLSFDSSILLDLDGPVGLISHSGSLSMFLSRLLSSFGLNTGKLVSCGNDADLTATDFLEYFGEDPAIRMVVMYLEGVRNGRHFFEVARRVSARKPVIIWKGGATERGAQAASSHTGALAGSAEVWRAVCKQAGVTLVGSTESLMDAATAFWTTRLPRGRRVAIVSGLGGMGVSLADACIEAGLELAQLSPTTHQALSQSVPGVGTSLGNPVDLGLWSRFHPDLYSVALKAIDQDPGVDAMLVVTTVTWVGDYTRPIFVAMPKVRKPVVASVLGTMEGFQARVPHFFAARVAPFFDTKRAARAIAWLYEYGAFLRRTGNTSQAEGFVGSRL